MLLDELNFRVAPDKTTALVRAIANTATKRRAPFCIYHPRLWRERRFPPRARARARGTREREIIQVWRCAVASAEERGGDPVAVLCLVANESVSGVRHPALSYLTQSALESETPLSL